MLCCDLQRGCCDIRPTGQRSSAFALNIRVGQPNAAHWNSMQHKKRKREIPRDIPYRGFSFRIVLYNPNLLNIRFFCKKAFYKKVKN